MACTSSDAAYRYVILVSAFMCIFLGTSLGYSSGVLHVALLDKYKEPVTVTAWLGALFSSTFCLLAPIGSGIVSSLSSRACVITGCVLNLVGFTLSSFSPSFAFLFLSYGVLAGAGQSFENVGTIVSVAYHFEKQRTLATGISLAGVGLGVVVFPPLTQKLLDEHGLDGAFLLLGAISFQSCTFAALLRPHTSEKKNEHITSSLSRSERCLKLDVIFGVCVRYCELFKNPAFLVLCTSILLWSSGVNACILLLPDYFISTGSQPSEASYLISLFGLGSVMSRLLTGMAAVEGGIDSKILYFGSYGVIGITTLCFPLFGSYFIGKLSFCFIFGLYTAGTFVLLSQLAIDVVGIRDFVNAIGVEYFVVGIGFLAGPTLASFIQEKCGYNIVFILVGCLFLCTSFLGLMVMLIMPKSDEHSETTDDKQKHAHEGKTPEEMELFIKDISL